MVQYGPSVASVRPWIIIFSAANKIMKYFKVSDLVVHSKCDLFQSGLSQYRAHWWYGHGCVLVVISRGRRIWVRMVRCPRQVLNAIEWRRQRVALALRLSYHALPHSAQRWPPDSQAEVCVTLSQVLRLVWQWWRWSRGGTLLRLITWWYELMNKLCIWTDCF